MRAKSRRGYLEGNEERIESDIQNDRPEAELLTVDELARVLRVPKATIYRWRSTGDGPRGYSIGRYVRFRWADIEAWLEKRADDPATERTQKMS
jgi:excisionase family DNA binding protein